MLLSEKQLQQYHQLPPLPRIHTPCPVEINWYRAFVVLDYLCAFCLDVPAASDSDEADDYFDHARRKSNSARKMPRLASRSVWEGYWKVETLLLDCGGLDEKKY
jgi:hypothetical protein